MSQQVATDNSINGNHSNPPECNPDVVVLTQWEPKLVEWLWEPYVPKGMITILSGAPASGKTYLALALAAGVTVGRAPYTNSEIPVGEVLYLSAGDNPEFYPAPAL
jgi:DNA repair protein RadA/Sms